MNARTTIGVALAGIFLIGIAVATMTMYTPRRAELMGLTTDVARAEEKLTNVMRHSGTLDHAASLLPRRSEEGDGDQLFLSDVNAELRRLGLELKRIEPKETEQVGEFTERSYQIDIEGRYFRAVEFLAHLEDISDVVVVRSFDVRSSTVSPGSTHKFSFKVKVIGY